MLRRVDCNHDYFRRFIGDRIYEAYSNRDPGECGPRVAIVVLPYFGGQYRIRVCNDHGWPGDDPIVVAEL